MTINSQRKALSNHFPVSRTTIDGWPAIFFSLPFMACGMFPILMAYDIIKTDSSNFHAPRPLVAAFGGLFVAAGFLVMIHGIQGLLRIAESKRLEREFPGSHAMADYHWDRGGIDGDGLARALNQLFGFCLFVVFLIPFNWLVFFTTEKIPGLIRNVIGFFDLIVMVIAGYCIYLLIRYFKYGKSRLKFHRFPYAPGQELSATVVMTKPIKAATEVKAILRFVEEKYETRNSGNERETVIVCYELYSETKDLTTLGNFGRDIEQIPIAFSLPNDLNLKNDLLSRPPKYWQLEIKAKTPGVDYLSHFLIPVY